MHVVLCKSTTLAADSSIWRSGDGPFDKCSCAAVQNEVHILFYCQDLFVCSLVPLFPFLAVLFCGGPYILHVLFSHSFLNSLS